MSCNACKNSKTINIKIIDMLLENKLLLSEANSSAGIYSLNRQSLDQVLGPRVNACFMEMTTEASKKIFEIKKDDYLENESFKNTIKRVSEKYIKDILTENSIKELISSSTINKNGEIVLEKSKKKNVENIKNSVIDLAEITAQIFRYVEYIFSILLPYSAIMAAENSLRIKKLEGIKKAKSSTEKNSQTGPKNPPADFVPLPGIGGDKTTLQEIKIPIIKNLLKETERRSSKYLKGTASTEIYLTYQDLADWFKTNTPNDTINEDVKDYVKLILSPWYEEKYGDQSIETSVDNTDHRIAPDIKAEVLTGKEAGRLIHQGAWQIYTNPKNDKWFPERRSPKPNYNPLDINNKALKDWEKENGREAAHFILNVVGIVDPLGIADLANFGLYVEDYFNASNDDKKSEAFFGAIVSLIGAAIPYYGDIIFKPIYALLESRAFVEVLRILKNLLITLGQGIIWLLKKMSPGNIKEYLIL